MSARVRSCNGGSVFQQQAGQPPWLFLREVRKADTPGTGVAAPVQQHGSDILVPEPPRGYRRPADRPRARHCAWLHAPDKGRRRRPDRTGRYRAPGSPHHPPISPQDARRGPDCQCAKPMPAMTGYFISATFSRKGTRVFTHRRGRRGKALPAVSTTDRTISLGGSLPLPVGALRDFRQVQSGSDPCPKVRGRCFGKAPASALRQRVVAPTRARDQWPDISHMPAGRRRLTAWQRIR